MSKAILLLISVFILGGCSNYGKLTFITKLPKKLNENSGIAYYKDSAAWFIEDGGNQDEIYNIDFKGNIVKELEVKNAKNEDWEDLAKDHLGNLYVGDFGNNQNDRKNLVVYKLPDPEKEKGDKIDAVSIKFKYPQQKEFPPPQEKLLYDSEAFFYYKQHLFIFTKSRANPFTANTLIYRIPAEEGTYDAEFLGVLKTCDDWNSCRVTSADISPNGKMIAVLSYGKLWLLTNINWDDLSKSDSRQIDLDVRTQLESVCFKDDHTLLFADEERGPTGRNLYSMRLKK